MSETLDLFHIPAMDPEAVKAHDALNDKIRKGNMQLKFLAVLRDCLYNKEISVNEMRHWIGVIEGVETRRPPLGPSKKRKETELVVPQ